MSRLLVVTQPALVAGFHLAGVEAFAADDAEEAQQLIAKWLDNGETGLLAIDEELLADFDSTFQQRLAAADQLPHLPLPSGRSRSAEESILSGRRHIAEMLRKAVGFHITFTGEQTEGVL